MQQIQVEYFSDILCVWAYAGQRRLNRLATDFADRIHINQHFCSVFPDSWKKIGTAWKDRGGFDGYAAHVRDVVDGFDGLKLHPDAWTGMRPRSSASPHLFVKAVEIVVREADGAVNQSPFLLRPSVQATSALREAFFEQGRDVAHWDTHREIASELGVAFDEITATIESGEAIAALAADYDLAQKLRVEGSPTYVLNDGRQKLFGNVSYGVIEANMTELLTGTRGDAASLCA